MIEIDKGVGGPNFFAQRIPVTISPESQKRRENLKRLLLEARTPMLFLRSSPARKINFEKRQRQANIAVRGRHAAAPRSVSRAGG